MYLEFLYGSAIAVATVATSHVHHHTPSAPELYQSIAVEVVDQTFAHANKGPLPLRTRRGTVLLLVTIFVPIVVRFVTMCAVQFVL